MEKDKVVIATASVLCVVWVSFYSSSSQTTLLVLLILSIWFQSSIVSYLHNRGAKEPTKKNTKSIETRKLMSSFKVMKTAYPTVMKDYQLFIQKLVKEFESSNTPSQSDVFLLASEFETMCTELDISLFGSIPSAWESLSLQIRNILAILQQRIFTNDSKRQTHSYPSNSYWQISLFRK